jgi:hypothetical protein
MFLKGLYRPLVFSFAQTSADTSAPGMISMILERSASFVAAKCSLVAFADALLWRSRSTGSAISVCNQT